MTKVQEWVSDDEKRTIILTAISGVFLLLSFATELKPFGIDLAWGSILISGLPVVIHSFKKLLFERNVRAGLLISIAVIACIVVGEYFAAAEVVFIMAIGELLEDYTVRRSKAGLKELIDMRPTTARVLRDGNDLIVDASEVVVGDLVRVKAGETVPVDGVIKSGATSIDQAVMTGESIPVDKAVGDEVFSATTNVHGSILVEATKVGEDSSIVKMITMITEAENKKAPIVRTMDKWASHLVLVALVLSVFVGLITGDVIRGITVLVVFCPCALVLATPTAIAAGIGNATKHGVIIKSGKALELLGRVSRIAFDKTGTLTIGEPKVKEIILADGVSYNKAELLRIAGVAERHSEHPLGQAIYEQAKASGLNIEEPDEFTVLPGQGVIATVGSNKVIIGNRSAIIDSDIKLPESVAKKIETQHLEGRTTVTVAINNEIAGVITLADTLRSDAKDIVRSISALNKKITLLTGDNDAVARSIASEVDITDYRAELLPEDKVRAIESFEDSGEATCMVGDGINDAPALKTASVGIAMAGVGSDIAADSADIILVKDELGKLPYITSLSSAVAKKVHVNIILSLSMNFGAIGLAAFGILGPVSGALMHNVSSVLVVLNAAMLLRRKGEPIRKQETMELELNTESV